MGCHSIALQKSCARWVDSGIAIEQNGTPSYCMVMSTTPQKTWQYLEPRPNSFYRQLFLKGTRIRAEIINGYYVNEQDPATPEAIAAEFGLPLEAVQEAISYCQSNPPEIEQDFRREEALMEASGMNDPDYKYHPSPKILSPQEMARIQNL
jgi:uncharacterized protein (DUF433 family)